MHSNKIFWSILVILLIAIVISWLSIDAIFKNKQTVKTISQESPNSIIYDAHYIHTNNQGIITEELSAPKVIHYAKNDTSQFNQPVLTLFGKKAPWVVTANTGLSYQGSGKIILKDNVKISQQNPDGATVLTTSEATIWPKKKFASTAAPVRIVQANNSIEGQGMTVDMQTGEIHLLSNARGEYAPTAPSSQPHH